MIAVWRSEEDHSWRKPSGKAPARSWCSARVFSRWCLLSVARVVQARSIASALEATKEPPEATEPVMRVWSSRGDPFLSVRPPADITSPSRARRRPQRLIIRSRRPPLDTYRQHGSLQHHHVGQLVQPICLHNPLTAPDPLACRGRNLLQPDIRQPSPYRARTPGIACARTRTAAHESQ